MNLTPETLAKLPVEYRDFLLVLREIPETRGNVLQVTALHIGDVYSRLLRRYAFSPRPAPFQPAKVRALADKLKERGLIEEDDYNFLKPTPIGEGLIEALVGLEPPPQVTVPDLPDELFR